MFNSMLSKKHCPHGILRGIYGDEINLVGGFRLQCLACGRYLYGPVNYVARNELTRKLDAENADRLSGPLDVRPAEYDQC